jgi:glycerol transport system permease protein
MKKFKWLVPTIYILFLMLPIYWLINMSFKTTTEIINTYSLWPQKFTLENYIKIFTDSTWYMGYVNSITYVVINTVISVAAALPAAYAFSRYKFLGDKHLFFWLLTNRMAPPAVFALPFFQFYSSVNLFDTHIAVALSHCLFNIPLAVSWVELLLAKTLTATVAKPIAATMTRTASTSGYELGLLAAAGTLTIIPGAFVIYFVRNYIAKGFAMGRV